MALKKGTMQIEPIQTEPECDAAAARITELMGARPGTEASDELESLAKKRGCPFVQTLSTE
jgi:hypothetical protein